MEEGFIEVTGITPYTGTGMREAQEAAQKLLGTNIINLEVYTSIAKSGEEILIFAREGMIIGGHTSIEVMMHRMSRQRYKRCSLMRRSGELCGRLI